MAFGKGTVNKVILLGRLGRDPELKYTPGGQAVVNFSLATNRVWKDQDGNPVERTDWHKIVAWRKTAEFVGNYLKKGRLVFIEGRLETRSWTDQNEVTRYVTEVIANSIEAVGPKAERVEVEEETSPPAEEIVQPQPEEPPDQTDDDLPF